MMISSFDLFIDSLPQTFLDTVKKEYLQKKQENEFISLIQAIKKTTERLIQNDPDLLSLKKQLTHKDLTQILRVTLRVLHYSIGVRECAALCKENDDPIIQMYTNVLLYHPGELEKIQQFLDEQWSHMIQLEKQGTEFSFADKMDILLALVTNAGQMCNFDVLSFYETRFLELLSQNTKGPLTSFYTSLFYTTLSFWVREKGELDHAMTMNESAIRYANELNHPYLLGYTANTTGAILMAKGDFSKAIQQFNESLKYLKTINDVQGMAYAYNNIGVIQNIWGHFAIARESFLKSNELHIQSLGRIFRTIFYSNIASTYRAERNFVEAIRTIEEGLSIERQNQQVTLDLLYLLVEQLEIYLVNGDIINAKKTFVELKRAIQVHESKTFTPLLYYYSGVLEAHEINLGLARKALQKAIKLSRNSADGYRIRLRAEIQLASVLLSNYRFSKNSAEFNQAFTLIENCIQACREQELIVLLCDILIIRAYLYSIQNNLTESRRDLKEAIELAERLGLEIQLSRAKKYSGTFLDKEEILTSEEKTIELLDYLKSSTSSILAFQLFKNPKIIESKLYGILFSTESGVPIYSQYFDQRLMNDDILLSGLLSGISSFTKELFTTQTQGFLRSITHENITILIEKIKAKLLVALFVDKDSYDIRTKLMELTKQIEKRITVIEQYYDQSRVEKNPKLEEIFYESIKTIYPEIDNLNSNKSFVT